jgi:hypothetical protein
MAHAAHCIALVYLCLTAAAFAQPAIPTSAALRDARLTVWASVNSKAYLDTDSVASQLKVDYPHSQVEWKTFPRDAFLPALLAGQQKGETPDLIFADNASQMYPILDSGRVRSLVGHPRFGRGWWMELKQSQNPTGADALLVWLERPPNWHQVPLHATAMSAEDRQDIFAIASQTVQSFNATNVNPPEKLLDPAISSFDWDQIHQRAGKDWQFSTPAVEDLGGNGRLGYAMVSTYEHGENSTGILDSLMVFRKDSGHWKLLLLEPSLPVKLLGEQLLQFDSIGGSRATIQVPPAITVIYPDDGQRMTRFPAGELVVRQDGATDAPALVEFQVQDPARKTWTPSTIAWLRPIRPGSPTHILLPFGVGQQPHRWRMWSFGENGEVSLTTWRTIDFTN